MTCGLLFACNFKVFAGYLMADSSEAKEVSEVQTVDQQQEVLTSASKSELQRLVAEQGTDPTLATDRPNPTIALPMAFNR